jgi:Fe-S-cluster-containing hydrogenase component 2
MPVLILRDRCDNSPRCFAAGACPNQALSYDERSGQVVVLPERCGGCRGPCLNFCDRTALKFATSMEELRLLQSEIDGTLSVEEIAQERLRLRQQEEERRKAEQVPEVAAANFQRDVLQARLPVVLLVDTPRSATWKRLASTLQQLAQQYVGQVLFRRVNADQEPQLVQALRVRSVPSFLLLSQAQLLDMVEGAVSAAQLQGWIQAALDQLRSLETGQARGTPPGSRSPGMVAPPPPGGLKADKSEVKRR